MQGIDPALMLHGYSVGRFLMAESRHAEDLFWVDAPRRGILPLKGFHLSRSLSRRLRNTPHAATINHAFAAVIDACADRAETWINAELRALYLQLNARGHAYSLEIWQEGELAGGVFGVTLGAAFFGESMFSKRTDGSKMALTYLVDHLGRCGFTLFETQFLTPHLASLGGIEIDRSAYKYQLEVAMGSTADFSGHSLEQDVHSVIQRMTQTS